MIDAPKFSALQLILGFLSRKFLMGLSGPIVKIIVATHPSWAEKAGPVVEGWIEILSWVGAFVTPAIYVWVEGRNDHAKIVAASDAVTAAIASEKTPGEIRASIAATNTPPVPVPPPASPSVEVPTIPLRDDPPRVTLSEDIP